MYQEIVRSISELLVVEEHMIDDYLLRLKEVFHCKFSEPYENSSLSSVFIIICRVDDSVKVEDEVKSVVNRFNSLGSKFVVSPERYSPVCFGIKFAIRQPQ